MAFADTYSLRTDTATLNDIADAIDALDTAKADAGSNGDITSLLCSSITPPGALVIRAGGALTLGSQASSSYDVVHSWDGTDGFYFAPAVNSSIKLGRPSYKWNAAYFTAINTNTIDVATDLKLITPGTTTSAANLFRDSDGTVKRITSAAKYKTDIRNIESGLAKVSSLRPVSFRDKFNFKQHLGFIAEEVAQVEPLLATRDETGEIEGIEYDRVPVLLVAAVQELKARIEALEAK